MVRLCNNWKRQIIISIFTYKYANFINTSRYINNNTNEHDDDVVDQFDKWFELFNSMDELS